MAAAADWPVIQWDRLGVTSDCDCDDCPCAFAKTCGGGALIGLGLPELCDCEICCVFCGRCGVDIIFADGLCGCDGLDDAEIREIYAANAAGSALC